MSYEQEVLLVRHPEIDRGGKALCYGHLDLGLTPRGMEMVTDLVVRARGWQPEALLSSDLQRCLIPAQAMSVAFGVVVEPSPIWREISMGEWEGKTWSEVEAASPTTFKNWMTDYIRLAPPQGETYDDLANRVYPAFQALAQRPEKRIWVMTHGGVIRSIVSRLLDLPLEKSWAMETTYASGVLLRRTGETWKLVFDWASAMQPTKSPV